MRTRVIKAAFYSWLLLLFMLVSATGLAQSGAAQPAAQPAGQDQEALRKATQNPVASLISVPIQENFNFDIGPFGRVQNVLNIQPVIPVSMSKNWNLIPVNVGMQFYGNVVHPEGGPSWSMRLQIAFLFPKMPK